MAIQDDNTVLCKGDLKAYHEQILPYLGGNLMLGTNVSDYYSTDEKIVGVWLDGKPVYQKTINATMPQVTTSGVEASEFTTLGVNNIDKIIKVDTIFFATNFRSGNYVVFTPSKDSNNIQVDVRPPASSAPSTWSIKIVSTTTSGNGWTPYVTVRYTKTTDAANSAVSTPGCYDINRPDLWPANKEIFFGNGLYGYRATGNYMTAMPAGTTDYITVVDRNIGFTTNYPTFNWGGNLQLYSNDASTIVNQPLNSRRGINFFSGAYIANAGNLRIVANAASGGQLRIRTQDKYDIWFTYTK